MATKRTGALIGNYGLQDDETRRRLLEAAAGTPQAATPQTAAPATDRASYGGSVYDQQYFTDDELRRAAKVRASAERGDTDWQSAHDYVEGLRSGYGYTGGQDGSKYIKLATEPLSYDNMAAKASQYDSYLSELSARLASRAPFSYDAASDPLYQQYARSYGESGRRAMQDTLAQISARTGGLASSYAGSAAQQAYNGYMARLADKVPELYKLAYDMYLGEGDELRSNLSALGGMSDRYYGRGRDAIADARYADELAYSRGRDAVGDARYADELAYARGRDTIGDTRYADELAYSRGRDTQGDRDSALSTVLSMIGSGYSAGSIPQYLLDQAGITGEQMGSMSGDYAAQAAASASRRSSGGGSTKSTVGTPTDSGNRWQGVDDYVSSGGKAEDYIKAYYKDMGFSNQTQALAAYKVYLQEQQAEYDSLDTIDYPTYSGLYRYVQDAVRAGDDEEARNRLREILGQYDISDEWLADLYRLVGMTYKG